MFNEPDILADAASRLGHQHGIQYGKLVINANTNYDVAFRIVNGYNANDPQIMDLCPKPLSGEWAGEAPACTTLDEIANLAEAYHLVVTASVNMNDALDEAESVLDVYEKRFNQGFWDTVIVAATSIVEAKAS
jgi:hypothetical protein